MTATIEYQDHREAAIVVTLKSVKALCVVVLNPRSVQVFIDKHFL